MSILSIRAQNDILIVVLSLRLWFGFCGVSSEEVGMDRDFSVLQPILGRKTLLEPFNGQQAFSQAGVANAFSELMSSHNVLLIQRIRHAMFGSSAGLSGCKSRLRSFRFHVGQMLFSSHKRWAMAFLCVLQWKQRWGVGLVGEESPVGHFWINSCNLLPLVTW